MFQIYRTPIYRTDEVADLSYRRSYRRSYRFIVQTKLQIYRTDKNSVHLFGGKMFQIYRTDEVTDLLYRQKQCAPVWWLDVSDLS